MRNDLKLLAWITVGILAVGGLGALAGCGAGASSQPVVYYSLDYPPARPEGLAPLPVALKVQRMGAAGGLDSLDMVYGPDPLELSVYNYNRWRVNPGDLVGDFLVRDMQRSALFPAVFSHRDGERARFTLEGSVERFREQDRQSGAVALIALNLTLLDRTKASVADRVLFQRRFQAEAPMADASARSLAQGLSQAMSRVSAMVIKDVHSAISRRLADG